MAWRKVHTLFCHLIKARLFTGKGVIKWQQHVHDDNLLNWHLNVQLSAGGKGTFNAPLHIPRTFCAPQKTRIRKQLGTRMHPFCKALLDDMELH